MSHRNSSVAPSAMSSKSSLWMALHNDCRQEAGKYGLRIPEPTQRSVESDQNLTARSTRFGNGNARIQSRKSRETPLARSPTPHRITSETARALDQVLPRMKPIAPTNTEPQSPNPFTTRYEITKRQVQDHAERPFCIPGRYSAQPTTTLPLPEVPNLTELMGGIHHDHRKPLFNSKNYQTSRFVWANQVGEKTDRVSLPDTDEGTPKYDEKKLRASVNSLENQVAHLQHLLAESEHNVQYLRQKAMEAESKEIRARGRSDSALGSVSGGSDAGEDKSDVEHRKLMIEKNRIMSENVELNRIILAYQEDLKTVTQQHADAVMQLEATARSKEQLEQQNQVLQNEIYRLRGHIDELMAYQERSTISFEANPNMTAKDAECDRIMYEREQAANTRQRIKASLQARREQVSEPIPNIRPLIFPISDDSREKRENQPTSCSRQEPKVTIDDVSMDLSYASNQIEEPKFEEPAVQEKLAFSRSQITSPDSQADDSFVPPTTTLRITDSLLIARRNIGKSQPTLPSLLDLDCDYEEQPSQPSLLDCNRKNQPALPSLLDDDRRDQPALPSLLDDERKNQPALPSLLDDERKNQPVLPSLLDCEANKLVLTSGPQQKTKKTKLIRRPVPVSNRVPVPGPFEEEPTIRPSQHPGIALATVLGALESELAELKHSAKKYQEIYDSHDAALSKRSRKNVFEKIKKLNQSIDVKADHIYSLYDVLEGQKQSGQEMSQEEIEVTLQSIGIDPEDITLDGSEFTGTHSTSSSRRS